jgi:glycosyltransferase involved in cell wall biosynthesis
MTVKIGSEVQISVVITCFNRRNFLVEAIQSVLRQSLSRDKYEILVTKNFEDHDIDLLLYQNGISAILEGNVDIGTMIANAINKANGRYVCFLDDDDIFYQNKLSVIYEATNNIPDIVYYHNSFTAINSDGSEMQDFKHSHPNSPMIFKNEISHSAISKIKKVSGDVNMSSIAVRRDLIMKNISYLNKVSSLQDVFIFYLSVFSPGIMMIDSNVLTGYRIHTSESHGDLATIDDYSAGIQKVMKKYLNSYEILLSLGKTIIIDLKYEYLTNKCRYLLMLPVRREKLTASELIYLFIHLRYAEKIWNQTFVIILSIIHLISPKKVSTFYIKRKMLLDSSKYHLRNDLAI